MTAIERTAYPQFKARPTLKTLNEVYTPTSSEIQWARSHARFPTNVLALTILLKSFQRLGYFPALADIPSAIVEHVQACLDVSKRIKLTPATSSLYRFEKQIRTHLGVTSYGPEAHQIAVAAVAKAALIKDHPADLINVAIEELIKSRFELPAYSTLDQLAMTIRYNTHEQLFEQVSTQLSQAEQIYLDQLIKPQSEEAELTLNQLKAPPKKATLSHLKELQSKYESLMSFAEAQRILAELTPAKIKYFAAQAQALDVAELSKINPAKRRTFLVCLIYRAQVKSRDHLAEMFLKRMLSINNRAKTRLVELREQSLATTESMLGILSEVLDASVKQPSDAMLGRQVQGILNTHGGAQTLLEQCQQVSPYNTKNHFPLMRSFFVPHRKSIFRMVRSLDIQSTSQDQSLITALNFLLEHEDRRSQYLPAELDLSFISSQWRKLVYAQDGGKTVLVRRQLEVCLFSYLATELKTGDACVPGSENYADFREQLLSWEDCQPLLEQYCQELEIPSTASGFVQHLRNQLTQLAQEVDQHCKADTQVTINQDDKPSLKRITAAPRSKSALELEKKILEQIPERSVLDVLSNVQHWVNWTRHFGPISGSEPKLSDPIERYLFTTFGYGCNLGPNETARHTRGRMSAHMLSYVHRRHFTTEKIEAAIRDIINAYSRLKLPLCWGTGKRAAADGSKFEIYDNNLISEYHLRYGGYGGIAYHHVSDQYIALFTHFITCGVWEAIYILDGLIKNQSDIQPDTIHADTQGQCAPAFSLSYLLGIQLMPRIRNWQNLSFFRPSSDAEYEYIDPLFKENANWRLIETHWQDLMRVVLSIRAGRLLPSTILRRLSSSSKKNRLYHAFEALGQVIRTQFLLRYISDRGLRRQVTECTNKVEGYNNFLDWLFFGKVGVITENDPDQQEKQLKYLELVSSAVIRNRPRGLRKI
ncbi:MAG: Tn3 family transposase [Thermosynechococcaceae cyanobacterium]